MATDSSSSTLRDTLVYFKKKLERTTDEDSVVHIIHKLSKVPITIDLLQGTGAGKIMRTLAKKPGNVGIKATSLLNKWREIVANSEKSKENLKQNALSKQTLNGGNLSCADVSLDEQSLKSEKHSKLKHSKDKLSKEKHSKERHFKENHSKEKHEEKYVKDIPKEKHTKEKHSKEYAKEKHLMSGHKEKSEYSKHSSIKLNGKGEKSVKSKHSLPTSEKITSKCLPDLIPVDQLFSDDCGYNPNYPDIYPTNKYAAKVAKASVTELHNDVSVTYEPTPKKSKLLDSESSKHHNSASKQTKVKAESSQYLPTNSSINKDANKTEFSHSHKKLSSKDSEVLIKKDRDKVKKSHDSDKALKKNKDSDNQSKTKKSSKKGLKIKPTEVFTSSEATFEDCLSFNDIVPIRKKKSSKFVSSSVPKKVKDSSPITENYGKIKDRISLMPPKPSIEEGIAIDQSISEEINQRHITKNKEKEVNLVSTLPQTQPNYRPLPQRNYDSSLIKKKVMSNEEAIKFTSSRREKTAVYSGRRNCYLTEVPTLFECCTRVLIENIDDIEYMGEIPYFLLESMLQRCTPSQLYKIEHYNPYLLEDTNELWEKHCKRDYRSSKPQENETWRELYLRSQEEQEQKLRSVTANITASIANSNPVRKAKLAYIDAVVKPPRDVARRQMKNGTALPTSHTVKAGPPSKASPRPTAPAINAASTSKARVEFKPQKPKVAPLMAKTLKSMKQCFRR